MRITQYFLGTFKEVSKNVPDIKSYRLMLRAGLIRKVASGLYSWMPTGLRVLRKIENVVRNAMNNIGAIEIFLPMVQPASLWKLSGRWMQYGPELLRFKNRSNQEFVLSPTHEELIASIVSKEVLSYKQLPIILYQIQSKFRDEIRPRFGMLRSREFIMKDGYSFHTNDDSLQNTYKLMYETYSLIFNEIGLDFRVIKADPGNIGGTISHEFHAIVNTGEDFIAYSTISNYASSIDAAEFLPSSLNTQANNIKEELRLVKILDIEKITNIVRHFNISRKKIVQMFIVRTKKNLEFPLLALLLRSDHELSYAKVAKLPQVSLPLSFINENEIRSLFGVNASVLGPINLPIPMIVDRDVASINNFVSGANIDSGYFFGINWERDLPLPTTADLRKVKFGDRSPDGKGILKTSHSIEIGHIFQLGNKYLNSSLTKVQGKNRELLKLTMGCYGIGISRIVSALIEQNNDKYGIIWPDKLAPFFLAIIPVNMYSFSNVASVAEKLYREFSFLNIDVLLDDRKESLGVMLSDIELIGVPHSIIISNRMLNNKEVEYKHRTSRDRKKIKLDYILDFFSELLKR